MRLVRGLVNLPPTVTPRALTIGNFDGVHRGHQAVLGRLREAARERGLRAAVMVFEPQPLEYFGTAPARLYRFADKLRALAALPEGAAVDEVIALRFDRTLARMEAADFVRMLVRRLGARYLLVGDDFRFGRGRGGDFDTLLAASRRYGFEAQGLDAARESGRRVSSTWIRELLKCDKIAAANRLLGRPYRITGRVVHGGKLGRALGWPTINIPLRRRRAPLSGIYAARVYGVEGEHAMDGVASIGTRPTVTAAGEWMLEVFLFDWNGRCYGRRAQVEFVRRLREEQRFTDLEALAAQIARDAAAARAALNAAASASANTAAANR